MSGGEGKAPPNEAMTDILASIRRIVADEGAAAGGATTTDEVFVLTPDMRVDEGGASAPSKATPAFTRMPTAPALPTRQAAAPGPQATQAATQATDTPPSTPAPAPAMSADVNAQPEDAAPVSSAEKDSPSILADEEALKNAVRAVLREEFSGKFGRTLTQQMIALVRQEIVRHEAEKHQDPPAG